MKSKYRSFITLLCTAAIPACTFLPSSGPSGYQIKAQSRSHSGKMSYHLYKINDQVLDVVKQNAPNPPCISVNERAVDASFQDRDLEKLGTPARQTIAPGDLLNISILETEARLFVPTAISGQAVASPITALPPQRIDQTGEITIPYVGRIQAAGRMPSELEYEIKTALATMTSDAQVVVNVTDRAGGNMITVTGDVRNPARSPISPAGTRVLDAISVAGGSPGDPFDYMVTVTRNEKSRSDALRLIYDTPSKNILLEAGDTVTLRKRKLNFLAFGATGKIAKFPITTEDLTLAEALSDSGGPSDAQANPSTVFIYRQEKPSVLIALGAKNIDSSSSSIPVIYQLKLNDPHGFFYADKFNIRDRDIIYYASSGSVGLMKFMNILNTLVAPAVTGVSGMSAAKVLSQ